jgi:hypothetical protein
MKYMKWIFLNILSCCLIIVSCREIGEKQSSLVTRKIDSTSTYGYDRDFLKKYSSLIELQKGQSKILIVLQYQGRVMTSSCFGDSGYSFGWINYDLIASKKAKEHINPYGGEERLWLAPEGGQFAFFFKKKTPYDFAHWFTPKEFDTEPFDLGNQTDSSVLFKKDLVLTNRSATVFKIHIDRKISLLGRESIEQNLQTALGNDIQVVAYKTENTLVNTGESPWTKRTGAPAVWLLGMLKPTPQTVIVLPTRGDSSSPRLHDSYFGKIPGDRLKLMGDHAFLKADGKFRGKVGIPRQNATKFIGSYDAGNKVLTLLECEWPANQKDFVNSAWEDQKDPFSGDVFNAYNDGPLQDGTQLGPFYEVESLSPAALLAPGKALTHLQITYHLQGDENSLSKISKQILGVDLREIENAFKQ